MTKPRTIDLDALLDEHNASVGPSDSSDTGADNVGVEPNDSTSDRNATGERASLEADRIVSAQEAGLGGGLDQAEEAQLGISDEEIDAAVREQLGLDLD